MVKEPKLTVKFFLHQGLKSRIVKDGQEWIPVYCKVTFLGRYSQLPMLDYADKEIFRTEEDFAHFAQDVENFGDFSKPIWWQGHWWELLSKRLILIAVIEKFFKEQGEKIDLKEAVSAFRIYEKSLGRIVRKRAIGVFEAMMKEKTILEPRGLEPIISEVEEDDKRRLELHTAYTAFLNSLREQSRWKNKDEGFGFIPPSKMGTVYSWLFEGEREAFLSYLKDKKKDSVIGSNGNTWGITPEFKAILSPDLEEAKKYVLLIDDLVKEIRSDNFYS